MIKVFIFGSCVSRDSFEYDEDKKFEIVEYYARSSFASLIHKPSLDTNILNKIESNFKRRCVKRDMDKSFFNDIKEKEYDILLIDLIDERHNLLKKKNNQLLTISVEYLNAVGTLEGQKIGRFTDKKLKLTIFGIQEFLKIAKEINIIDKIRINKVYWHKKVDKKTHNFKHINHETIDMANDFLDNLYEEFAKVLPSSSFIMHNNKNMYCDSNHKFGIDPFHYNKDFYIETLDAILLEKNLNYIEDNQNHKLFYDFRPATNPKDAPLLVILHGHTFNSKPSKFYDENWNVLVPIDNFGINNCGSWWLGEEGNYFVMDLLHRLILKVRLETQSSKGLYFWGSSMGGFGALLHGMQLNAQAVYANIPQIKLLTSSYSEGGNKKYFEPIFKEATPDRYNDVTHFLDLKEPKNNPLFFIAQSRFDYPNYLEEHALYFFNKCMDFDINIHMEIAPVSGHTVIYPIHQAIKYFDKFTDITLTDTKFNEMKIKINFIKNNLFNNHNILKGKKLIRDNYFQIDGFKDFLLNEDVDWESNIYDNRTWMWRLHQMSFIEYLLAYDIENITTFGTKYALLLIKSHFRIYEKNNKSLFAWHDHATALRAINFIKLKIWLDIHNEDTFFLIKVMIIHAEKLMDSSFYSQNTNHGLDQSIALYMLSKELSDYDVSKEWYRVAVERIVYEVNHAFVDDGMHVENSPAYLNFGIKQILEVIEVSSYYGDYNEELLKIKLKLSRAVEILAYMVKPNGLLPLIGDTKDFKVRDNVRSMELDSYNTFIYSIYKGQRGLIPEKISLILEKSGWAIFRETWKKDLFEQSLHLVFKCGFLSNYHRHDDDLHFVLYAYGEDWLIDGGEYKHDQSNPYRLYFRSAESHTLSMPYAVRAHRILDNSSNTFMKEISSSDEETIVRGVSSMFLGFENSRELTYNRKKNLIEVKDTCIAIKEDTKKSINTRVNKKWTTYITRFMVPNNKTIVRDKNKLLIHGVGDKVMVIKYENFNGNITIIKGGKSPNVRGWTSSKSNILEEAYSIEFHHKTKALNFEYVIFFETKPALSAIETLDIRATALPRNSIKVEALIKNKNKFKGVVYYAYILYYDKKEIMSTKYTLKEFHIFDLDKKYNINKVKIVVHAKDKHGNKLRANIRIKI